MDPLDALKHEMIDAGRRMYARGLIAAGDGNISARLPDGNLLITRSGICKGTMTPEDLIVIDPAGNPLTPGGRPSSEYLLHTTVFRLRPDAGAVVHAHPPIATAFTVAGLPLASCVLPELVIALGRVPTAPYATPTTPDLARSIEPLVPRADAVLLEMHGSVTLGAGVLDAYYKLERLEHAALVTFAARQIGQVKVLPAPEVERLLRVRQGLGIRGPVAPCNACGACVTG